VKPRRTERRREAAKPDPWGARFAIAGWFVAGLIARIAGLGGAHREGDEIVYTTLVHQLEAGNGYTLRGTPLIGPTWPADQYGRALFFHPPGGIGFFYVLHGLFGDPGFALAQVLSWALFFAAMLWLARLAIGPLRGPLLHAVCALAAFTPILAHVASRYWLDAPQLAMVTLASALYVFALTRGSSRWATIAGLALGAASWIKSSAFVILPGLLLLGWGLTEPRARGRAIALSVRFAIVAALVQLPWEIWQWVAVGSPFPAWAGKPSPALVAGNRYVYTVTVLRPPWIYFTLTPRALWTVGPALAGLALGPLDARSRRIGVALVAWIVIVLAVVAALGATGYSKLLRYAILMTPATVLLFAVVANGLLTALADSRASEGTKTLARALAALAVVGLALEVTQGLYTPLVDTHADLIRPILWSLDSLR
jgi:4-amino-4-deoxy-L-arabinose transferase-like glycosyltransferase